jgi:hypothetical protein
MGNSPSLNRSQRADPASEDLGTQTPRVTPDTFLQMQEFNRLLMQRNLLSQQFLHQQQQQIAAPLITARTYKPSYLIHKDTFALYDDSIEDSHLKLRFEFDAQRPCIVKVFYVAVELTNGSKKPLTERLFTKLLKKGELPSSAADTRRFDAGTRIVFDQRISSGTSSSSSLNLRQYSLEELSHIPKSSSSFWGSTNNQPSIASLSQKALNSLTEIKSLKSIGCDIDAELRVKSVPSMMSPIVIVIEDDTTRPTTEGSQLPQIRQDQSTTEHESYSYFGCFTAYEGRHTSADDNNNNVSTRPPILGVIIFQERLQLGETVYYIKELYGSVSNSEKLYGSVSNSETSSGPLSGGGEGEMAASNSASISSTSPKRESNESMLVSSNRSNNNNNSSSSSSSSPGATMSGSADIIDGAECVICLTDRRTTIVMPCRHLCLCTTCAEDLRVMSNKCPVCRGAVTRFLAIDTPLTKTMPSPTTSP